MMQQVCTLLERTLIPQPAFQQAMSQVLSDPRMVDYLIQSQPQLQAMGPGVRQYMQSDEFRRIMTDPNMFRNMMEMNRMFSQMGMQVPGMPPARQQSNFPAPGVTNTTQPQHQQAANRTTAGTQQQPSNPFEAMWPPPLQGQGQSVANAPNPFMALFPTAQPGAQSPFGSPPPRSTFGNPPPPASVPQQQPQGFGSPSPPLNSPQGGIGSPYSAAQQPGTQPFGQGQQPANLQSMWSMLQGLNSMLPPGGVGQTPLSPGQTPSFIPPGLARPVPDARPIEERYQASFRVTIADLQDELRQLNDMGFTDFARNIAALRRTGGNVEAAVEMLISGTV
jgi:ubiquilin